MWNIIEFDKVTSTNEIAGEMLARGEAHHGDVVQARHQSAGRGRGAGRVWSDEPGASLLMSIIFEKIPEPANLLQYRSALAVLTSLRNIAEECGKSPKEIILKWPNDILIRNKKVCGILLEAQWNASAMRSAVIGIGVNVKQKSFPEELASIATSLSQCGIETEVNSVRDKILNVVETELYGADSYEANQNSILGRLRVELEWMSKLKSLRLTNVDGSVLTGLNFVGINDSGALNLRRADESMMVAHSGSLSWDV
jgi:BirA family biotin operon repressor/biotin-[acetyl-CoA-carboxylase] ligase